MTPELLRALLTVGFGSLAGGITNTVAVWMLFHPYHPVRLGPLRLPFLHGAIPKNQDRLAAAVGRTVGDRLLTEEDLTRIFSNVEFRRTFDVRLGAFLESLLERERGTVRELFPAEALSEVEALLDEVADHLALRLDRWLDSAEFEEAVADRAAGFVDRLAEAPVADLLTPEREQLLADAAERWLAEAVERQGFRAAVDDYLDGMLKGVLRPERTCEEVLPGGLADTLEHALARFLPVAARRLGGVLEDPDARSRLERTLRELFQRFLRDLRFHQRVVARLVVTDQTVDRVLETLEEEGAERLSEMLRDPAVQEAIARRVNDGVVEILRRPVTEVVGHPDDPGIRAGRETMAAWIVDVARDPSTREYAVEKIRQGLGRIAGGTWGDLLRSIPPDRIAQGLVATARSDEARRVYRQALRRTLDGLLDRPLGRPGDWLPAGARSRVQGTVSDPLWRWLQGQVPEVVKTLDVGRRVEEKVRDYPVERMEDLVRRVTSRELRLIVRLGYVLGAVIGAILVGANALVG
jgi:uncharacterized membrane protein YheB (UPF0754 family)